MCQRPVRSREYEMWWTVGIMLAVLPTVPLRMYVRWTTMRHFAVNDYLMMVCGVSITSPE